MSENYDFDRERENVTGVDHWSGCYTSGNLSLNDPTGYYYKYLGITGPHDGTSVVLWVDGHTSSERTENITATYEAWNTIAAGYWERGPRLPGNHVYWY